MTPPIKITVITVVKNAEKTIERTIRSVLKQKNNSVEYIIIDGGSTDRTKDIISLYTESIDYYISNPDNGIYDAMNKGIKESKGDVIAFLNADDWYADGVFGLVDAFFDLDTVDILYGDTINVYPDGFCEVMKTKDAERLRYEVAFCHQSSFVKRSLLIEIGGFNCDYSFCADYYFFLKCLKEGKRFLRIDETIAYCSMDGISNTNAIECAKEQRMIANRLSTNDPDKLAIEKYNNKRVGLVVLRNQIENDVCTVLHNIGRHMEIDETADFVIWGAGIWGRRIFGVLKEKYKILYFIDTDKNKTGLFEEIPIINCVEDINHETYVFISTLRDYHEIICCLLGLGMPQSHIITLEDIIDYDS